MQSRDQRLIWHYGWVSFIISCHSAKFGGHQPCGRGDILFLIYHLNSCDYGLQGHMTLLVSFHYYKSPSCQVCWPQALRKRRNFIFCLWRDLTWLRSQRVMWHYGWLSLLISDYPAMFGDHRPFGRGNIELSICHLTSSDQVDRGSRGIMGEFPSS